VAHGKLQTAYDKLEETTKAKERIESELRIAHDIQRSILPNEFAHHQSLDLYAYMKPAKEVGGDLYDYLLDDDYLYICLGDVSGKGVPAALFMAQATRMFRALAREKCTPQDIATRLNDELTEGNENGMFVTMFIAYINMQTGRMDFCNAGHNPPVIDGQFLEVESNAPIGLWPAMDFVGEHIDNIKGRRLFIYSDGLNEAENRQQVQFGDERMLQILRDTHFDHAKQLIEYLRDEVEKHRNGAEPNDDLTMMALKID
jgi:serine phosphatase RsbU (regulator of sigma subunit)